MNETRKERGMRNDPVDMGKLIKALEVSMIHDLPITLVPKEAKKLRGELLAWERMVGTLLAEREKYRWVSVEERLPELDEYVIAYNQEDARVQVYANFGESFGVGFYGDILAQALPVTHWMPLPAEPPESEEMTDETDELDSRMEIVISIEAFGEDRILIFPLIKDKYTDEEKKRIISDCLERTLERFVELLTEKESET